MNQVHVVRRMGLLSVDGTTRWSISVRDYLAQWHCPCVEAAVHVASCGLLSPECCQVYQIPGSLYCHMPLESTRLLQLSSKVKEAVANPSSLNTAHRLTFQESFLTYD